MRFDPSHSCQCLCEARKHIVVSIASGLSIISRWVYLHEGCYATSVPPFNAPSVKYLLAIQNHVKWRIGLLGAPHTRSTTCDTDMAATRCCAEPLGLRSQICHELNAHQSSCHLTLAAFPCFDAFLVFAFDAAHKKDECRYAEIPFEDFSNMFPLRLYLQRTSSGCWNVSSSATLPFKSVIVCTIFPILHRTEAACFGTFTIFRKHSGAEELARERDKRTRSPSLKSRPSVVRQCRMSPQ